MTADDLKITGVGKEYKKALRLYCLKSDTNISEYARQLLRRIARHARKHKRLPKIVLKKN